MIEQALTSGWTTGAVGVWGLLITVLGIYWKGLPAVIEKMDQRRAGIEERAREFLAEERARFKQVTDEMEVRLGYLRDEVDSMRKENGGLRHEIDGLRKENSELRGLLRGMQQGQNSAYTVVATAIKDAKSD